MTYVRGSLPCADDIDELLDAYRLGERALHAAITKADREERGWYGNPHARVLHERAEHIEDHLRALDYALRSIVVSENTARRTSYDPGCPYVNEARDRAAEGARRVPGTEDGEVVIGYIAVSDPFAPEGVDIDGRKVEPGTYAVKVTGSGVEDQMVVVTYLLSPPPPDDGGHQDTTLSTLKVAAVPSVALPCVYAPGIEALGGSFFMCEGSELHQAISECGETGIPAIHYGLSIRLDN